MVVGEGGRSTGVLLYVLLHYVCAHVFVMLRYNCVSVCLLLQYTCECVMLQFSCMYVWCCIVYLCMLQYTYLVTSQLEAQRLYFEEKMERIEKEAIKQVSKTRH